jgi:multisubunit Na+/H+ antiporter MnhG subunit
MRYILLLLGLALLNFDEFYNEAPSILSVFGLIFFIIGLYLISLSVGQKPDYNPFSIQSYEEEE